MVVLRLIFQFKNWNLVSNIFSRRNQSKNFRCTHFLVCEVLESPFYANAKVWYFGTPVGNFSHVNQQNTIWYIAVFRSACSRLKKFEELYVKIKNLKLTKLSEVPKIAQFSSFLSQKPIAKISHFLQKCDITGSLDWTGTKFWRFGGLRVNYSTSNTTKYCRGN